LGRHGWRPVVEDGLKLDSYRLQRDRLLNPRGGGFVMGSLVWTYTSTGERVASVGYTVDYSTSSFTLNYTTTVREEKRDVTDRIRLIKQRTNFGGVRFMFLCPSCQRRAAKLYLPGGGVYFRCRRCYNLTYTSSNESRKFDGLYRIIARNLGTSPTAVKSALKRC
jgi:hypothetical protein